MAFTYLVKLEPADDNATYFTNNIQYVVKLENVIVEYENNKDVNNENNNELMDNLLDIEQLGGIEPLDINIDDISISSFDSDSNSCPDPYDSVPTKHLQSDFFNNANDIFKKAFEVERNSECQTQNVFKCEKCSKIFKAKRYLLEHHRNIHGVANQFECDKCGKIFKTQKARIIHMNIHSESNEFECEKCKRTFKTKRYLIQHDNNVHQDTYNFECDKCGRRFKTRRYLLQHERSVHCETRDFKCFKCGNLFKTKKYLLHHMSIHSESNDYECDTCGKAFKTKDSLIQHLNLHKDSYSFKCSKCGRAFKTKHYLAQHDKNMHLDNNDINYDSDEIECVRFDKCEDKLKNKPYILQHEKLVNKYYFTFGCDKCGKTFTTRRHLIDHVKVHNESKTDENAMEMSVI